MRNALALAFCFFGMFIFGMGVGLVASSRAQVDWFVLPTIVVCVGGLALGGFLVLWAGGLK